MICTDLLTPYAVHATEIKLKTERRSAEIKQIFVKYF